MTSQYLESYYITVKPSDLEEGSYMDGSAPYCVDSSLSGVFTINTGSRDAACIIHSDGLVQWGNHGSYELLTNDTRVKFVDGVLKLSGVVDSTVAAMDEDETEASVYFVICVSDSSQQPSGSSVEYYYMRLIELTKSSSVELKIPDFDMQIPKGKNVFVRLVSGNFRNILRVNVNFYCRCICDD